ncbi:hypothetical protein [Streptomyces sp. NPDC059071]|uniref:hypothetical protein n=1 Tax=unclassified Streptomyces TaxID=2593676 RepID=UPI00365474DB
MIKLTFTVSPGQGEPSGFDLGDMVCEGEGGPAASTGHVPDQGMMIHLSVPLLLHQLESLLSGERRKLTYTPIGSSYRLDFHRHRDGHVRVRANGIPVGRCSTEGLARAVLTAAQSFADEHLETLPAGDPAAKDYTSALRRFRQAQHHPTT